MSTRPAAVVLHDLTFGYAGGAAPALRGVSFAVPDGTILGVVGRAGAGKSTLCAVCTGFVPHFFAGDLSGTARVDGEPVLERSPAQLAGHVALVGGSAFSQISGARQTVFEEVAFALENTGVARAEIILRVEAALETLQIRNLRDRSPYALSGGQQQRMLIAGALALRPSVLVLDEPTAQLDPPAVADLGRLLRELATRGTTIVVAEHRLEWVAEVADAVLALDVGAVLAHGPTATVLADERLRERGIGWARPTQYALAARAQGSWPAAQPLATTIDGLRAGLRGPLQIRPPAPPAADAVTEPLVRTERISYTYPSGVTALRDATLQIVRGETVGLLGRNGAGKSTLVRHLNGLLRPSSGRVQVMDLDTQRVSVARCARHVGIVFQDIRNQLFARSVREELAFGPRNLGFKPERVRELVDQTLRVLQLETAADTHPYDLPAPQRRLVAVGAALAMDVDLLVLDEPTAGLDVASVELLGDVIRVTAAQGKSVLVVTHDLDFCFERLDRVVIMRDGQITHDAPTHTLRADTPQLVDSVGLPLMLRV